jgi:hypothetical protein
MWRHANGESPESLLAALRDATELQTTPTLAGRHIRLRFVAVHLQDLEAAMGVEEGELKVELAEAPRS